MLRDLPKQFMWHTRYCPWDTVGAKRWQYCYCIHLYTYISCPYQTFLQSLSQIAFQYCFLEIPKLKSKASCVWNCKAAVGSCREVSSVVPAGGGSREWKNFPFHLFWFLVFTTLADKIQKVRRFLCCWVHIISNNARYTKYLVNLYSQKGWCKMGRKPERPYLKKLVVNRENLKLF